MPITIKEPERWMRRIPEAMTSGAWAQALSNAMLPAYERKQKVADLQAELETKLPFQQQMLEMQQKAALEADKALAQQRFDLQMQQLTDPRVLGLKEEERFRAMREQQEHYFNQNIGAIIKSFPQDLVPEALALINERRMIWSDKGLTEQERDKALGNWITRFDSLAKRAQVQQGIGKTAQEFADANIISVNGRKAYFDPQKMAEPTFLDTGEKAENQQAKILMDNWNKALDRHTSEDEEGNKVTDYEAAEQEVLRFARLFGMAFTAKSEAGPPAPTRQGPPFGALEGGMPTPTAMPAEAPVPQPPMTGPLAVFQNPAVLERMIAADEQAVIKFVNDATRNNLNGMIPMDKDFINGLARAAVSVKYGQAGYKTEAQVNKREADIMAVLNRSSAADRKLLAGSLASALEAMGIETGKSQIPLLDTQIQGVYGQLVSVREEIAKLEKTDVQWGIDTVARARLKELRPQEKALNDAYIALLKEQQALGQSRLPAVDPLPTFMETQAGQRMAGGITPSPGPQVAPSAAEGGMPPVVPEVKELNKPVPAGEWKAHFFDLPEEDQRILNLMYDYIFGQMRASKEPFAVMFKKLSKPARIRLAKTLNNYGMVSALQRELYYSQNPQAVGAEAFKVPEYQRMPGRELDLMPVK